MPEKEKEREKYCAEVLSLSSCARTLFIYQMFDTQPRRNTSGKTEKRLFVATENRIRQFVGKLVDLKLLLMWFGERKGKVTRCWNIKNWQFIWKKQLTFATFSLFLSKKKFFVRNSFRFVTRREHHVLIDIVLVHEKRQQQQLMKEIESMDKNRERFGSSETQPQSSQCQWTNRLKAITV